MFDDMDFAWGMLFGASLAEKKREKKESQESREKGVTYEEIHEILIKNFNAKKEIFEKFDRKEEISKCFYNVDHEIKKLFE